MYLLLIIIFAFFAGDGGLILEYKNNSISVFESGTFIDNSFIIHIKMFDELDGFIITDHWFGKLMEYKNGNWSQIYSDKTFSNFYFLSNQLGFIWTYYNEVYKFRKWSINKN